jgi:DNA-binding NtrC family response regulator
MPEKNYLNGKRVLIVDDEADVLETLKDLLSMCEIETASNFETAKEMLLSRYYDIAILDIMGVDGYELLAIANRQEIIAVMLTAHACSVDNIIKSHKEGAASYIPKEEMIHIGQYLNDVLDAKEKGLNFWHRWMDRLGDFCEKRFGPEWQKKDQAYWEKFKQY